MAGIERADQWENRLENGLTTSYFWKIELQLLAGGPEVENAIFSQGGGERIGVALVETKAIAVKSVGDFVTVVGELGEVGGHDLKLDRINRIYRMEEEPAGGRLPNHS
jgi:hypothetical protein